MKKMIALLVMAIFVSCNLHEPLSPDYVNAVKKAKSELSKYHDGDTLYFALDDEVDKFPFVVRVDTTIGLVVIPNQPVNEGDEIKYIKQATRRAYLELTCTNPYDVQVNMGYLFSDEDNSVWYQRYLKVKNKVYVSRNTKVDENDQICRLENNSEVWRFPEGLIVDWGENKDIKGFGGYDLLYWHLK